MSWLFEDVTYLQYSSIHCNADWRPSDLSDLEYLGWASIRPGLLIENFFTAIFARIMCITGLRFQCRCIV